MSRKVKVGTNPEFEKAKQARIKRFTKEREFDELKNEVSEIKLMLKQLLEKS